MAKYEQMLSGWLGAHHGVVTSKQLKDWKVSRQQKRTLLDSGRLLSKGSGAFCAAGSPATEQQEWVLACTLPGSVLCGVSAGRLWQFRHLVRLGLPTVWLPARAQTRSGLAEIRRSSALEPIDVVERDDGIRLTSPPRTVYDLAAMVSADVLESIIEQGLDRGNFTLATLWATARRLDARGRDGSRALARVLSARPAWLAPVDSALELRFERAVLASGAPRPVRQLCVVLDNDQEIHPDFAWPDLSVIVEVDHVTWHGGRRDSVADKRRDRQLARVGWTVLRITDTDLAERQAESAADVVAVLRARQASLANSVA